MMNIIFVKMLGESGQADPKGEVIELEWHINETLYSRERSLHDYVATLVQADGHELDYVLDNYQNIPWASKKNEEHLQKIRVQRWRGDFAAFIVDHLPR